MTNKEYYIKNGISFADALKDYDDKKYPTVEKWFLAERKSNKFNVGDICFNKYSTSVSVIKRIERNLLDKLVYEGIKILNTNNGGIKWCVFREFCKDFDSINTKIGTADKDFMEFPNL